FMIEDGKRVMVRSNTGRRGQALRENFWQAIATFGRASPFDGGAGSIARFVNKVSAVDIEEARERCAEFLADRDFTPKPIEGEEGEEEEDEEEFDEEELDEEEPGEEEPGEEEPGEEGPGEEEPGEEEPGEEEPGEEEPGEEEPGEEEPGEEEPPPATPESPESPEEPQPEEDKPGGAGRG
ncbi:MAG: hypothetical protein ACYS47_19925, partial [Planctomycetota bacterium]